MFPFYIPWKSQGVPDGTSGFLTFSGGTEKGKLAWNVLIKESEKKEINAETSPICANFIMLRHISMK